MKRSVALNALLNQMLKHLPSIFPAFKKKIFFRNGGWTEVCIKFLSGLLLFLYTKNVNRDTNAVAIDQWSQLPRWKSNGKNSVEQTSPFFFFFFFFFLEKHYCSGKIKLVFLKVDQQLTIW